MGAGGDIAPGWPVGIGLGLGGLGGGFLGAGFRGARSRADPASSPRLARSRSGDPIRDRLGDLGATPGGSTALDEKRLSGFAWTAAVSSHSKGDPGLTSSDAQEALADSEESAAVDSRIDSCPGLGTGTANW